MLSRPDLRGLPNQQKTDSLYQPDQTPGELHAVANVLTVFPDAQVITAPDMGAYAVEYALQGLAIGPLCKRDRDPPL